MVGEKSCGTHITCTRVDHASLALLSRQALVPQLSRPVKIHVSDHDLIRVLRMGAHVVRDEPSPGNVARGHAVHGEELDLAVPAAAHRDLRRVEGGQVQEATGLAHLGEDAHKLAGVLELEYLRGS